MRSIVILVSVMWFVASFALGGNASAQALPPGWSSPAVAGDAPQVFRPNDLAPGEDTAVVHFPRSALGGATLDQWLERALKSDAAPTGGTWSGTPGIESKAANLAMASRIYRDAAGKQGFAIYMAVASGKDSVRLARWSASSEAVGRRYQAAAQPLMQRIAAVEKDAAPTESRAGDGEGVGAQASGAKATAEKGRRTADEQRSPPEIDGLHPGGDLTPGRYAGTYHIGTSGNHAYELVVLLHANGEYDFVTGNRKPGKYAYERGTGKLDIGRELYNSASGVDDSYCLFGRDGRGTPTIRAYRWSVYSSGGDTVELRRTGDVDRQPPSVVAAAEAAARAEARRYKWVTEPGKGLRTDQVETILYVWKQVWEVTGLSMKEDLYLLLKDGTVHDGVPVPPQDMDVPASRKREPKAWGRWKRSGGGYAFAWGDKADNFSPVSQGLPMQAGRDGMTLEGMYSDTVAYSIPGSVSSVTKYGVTFGADGRFERFHSGSMTAGGPMNGSEAMSSTRFDDQGAVTSSTAPNVAIGSQSRKADRGNRTGTYRVEGYALELHYDDGTTVRRPFFTDGSVKQVWFEGGLLRR